MRVTISGQILSFRYQDTKQHGKVGQFDILQNGNEVDPTKIVQIYIASREQVRLILEQLQQSERLYITLLAWLEYDRQLDIHIKEILALEVGA